MSASTTGHPDIDAGGADRPACSGIEALGSFSTLEVKVSSKEGFRG